MALARTPRAGCGRLDDHHARHAENQAEYPQVPGQRRGCGFPIARIVVVFSLAVGTVLDAAIGKYQGKQTGENSLFRTLHGLLQEGDVVLADRYFSGWFDLALLQRARRGQRGPQTSTAGHRLSHRPATGPRRSPGVLEQARAPRLDEQRTIRRVA